MAVALYVAVAFIILLMIMLAFYKPEFIYKRVPKVPAGDPAPTESLTTCRNLQSGDVDEAVAANTEKAFAGDDGQLDPEIAKAGITMRPRNGSHSRANTTESTSDEHTNNTQKIRKH
jgi:hypothetical protein